MNPSPHQEFIDICRRRYSSMKQRFGPLPFTVDRFQEFVTDILSGEQGLVRCEYCNQPLDILRLELDHRLPPRSQGGSLGLDNLAPCCKECNAQKGEMSAPAYKALRELIFTDPRFTSVDRIEVLGRLQSQLKLAIREQARLAELRKTKVSYQPHRRQSA